MTVQHHSMQEQPGLSAAEAGTAAAATDPPPGERPLRLRTRIFRPGPRWGALAIEVLAIVFAILLAFLIDAWWEERQDRRRERAYIVKLIEEFEANRREVERDLRARGELIAGYERLLRATAPNGTTLGADSAGALVVSLIRYRWYTPVHAVYEELVASGGLDLLRSDSLRTALFRYVQERDRVAGVEEAELTLQRQQVIPYVAARGELLPWLSENEHARLDIERPTPVRDPRHLLTDPAFVNLVYLRWEGADLVQRYSEILLGTVQDVLRWLRAEVTR